MTFTRATSQQAQPCPACLSVLSRELGQISGYVRGHDYVVSECEHCRCQTVQPTHLPDGLYDAIYANASQIEGGYDRYLRYAREIVQQSSPFDWLAEQEDMYWGVRQVFQDLHLPAGTKVVEVGCGMGYLTHAMRMAGFDAHGIDVAKVAIDEARRRFGNHYSVGDAVQSSRVGDSIALVAMELIEHLSDPAAFLNRLRRVMNPAAKLIISTPNRDTYPRGVVWNTDLPPVHFHWFTELAIKELAHRCGFDATFVDFTSRNSRTRSTRWIASPRYRSPRLDESFAPIKTSNSPASRRLTPSRLIAALSRKILRTISRVTSSNADVLTGSRSVATVALLSPIA